VAGVGSVPAAWGLAQGRALARAWVRALGRPPLGAGAGRVKPGSGARAGQTRIGRAGGSNPKREMRRAKKKRPGANKTTVATVLADIDLTPPFDLNLGLNLGLNHTKNLRFKPRFKPGFFCGGFKPRFKPRVGVRCKKTR
jgi:hypothetical protein